MFNATAALFRALLFTVMACFSGTVAAQDLPMPTGQVLLSVSGDIAVTNGDGMARFDIAMLQDMPAVTFMTSTPWTVGTQKFTGVPLRALLDRLGIIGGNLAATAINDYAVTIPVDTASESAPIIAYHHNDKAMAVRDKGPLWIIYPYDSDKSLQNDVTYSRSIWQLDRVVVTR